MAKQTSSRSKASTGKTKSTPPPASITDAPAPITQVIAQRLASPEGAGPEKASPERTAASSAGPGKPAQGGVSQSSHAPSHEQIARRAYELYQTRSFDDGSALHDWLRAESDLRIN